MMSTETATHLSQHAATIAQFGCAIWTTSSAVLQVSQGLNPQDAFFKGCAYTGIFWLETFDHVLYLQKVLLSAPDYQTDLSMEGC